MLDKRYGGAYHYCRHCLRELAPAHCGPMNVAPPAFCGPLSFTACSWSLTASYSTGPQIRNRWRAVAPQDFATPGTDRVRQQVATPGLQIPLEQQLGESAVSLGSLGRTTAFTIVAPKVSNTIPGRSEYQNPHMGCSEFEVK